MKKCSQDQAEIIVDGEGWVFSRGHQGIVELESFTKKFSVLQDLQGGGVIRGFAGIAIVEKEKVLCRLVREAFEDGDKIPAKYKRFQPVVSLKGAE